MSTIERSGATEFVDILCDDPDWLRAEFDELIAAAWGEPPERRPLIPPRRPSPIPYPRRRAREHRRTGGAVRPSDAWARQRGPPRPDRLYQHQ